MPNCWESDSKQNNALFSSKNISKYIYNKYFYYFCRRNPKIENV